MPVVLTLFLYDELSSAFVRIELWRELRSVPCILLVVLVRIYELLILRDLRLAPAFQAVLANWAGQIQFPDRLIFILRGLPL